MWYEIKQGRHRAYPLSLGIHTGKTQERYEVIFDESCRYQLDEENQEDWNKLVGWSYGLHHTNSIRVAWRYNPKIDRIEVCIYYYLNKERLESSKKFYLELNKKYTLTLGIDLGYFITERITRFYLSLDNLKPNFAYLHDSNIIKVDYYGWRIYPTWGYNLGLYFGGSEVQPNKEDMKVWIKKL